MNIVKLLIPKHLVFLWVSCNKKMDKIVDHLNPFMYIGM